MSINFILKKYTKEETIYKTARVWEEIEKLRESGFETFNRKEYEQIRAMSLNETLCREVKNIRRKIGLPERGLSVDEYISIMRNPEKFRNFIFGVEKRFNQLLNKIHADYTLSPEVCGQLYNLVLCGHAVYTSCEDAIYLSSNGFSPYEVEKNRIVIAISRCSTLNALHQFINRNADLLERMFDNLYRESPTISERDIRIYEIRKTTGLPFHKIADQIIREFKLDDKNAEMNYGSAKTAYLRAKHHIGKLFAPRKGT